MVTQLLLIPTASELVWPCRSTPPAQSAGHERVKFVPPKTVVVIGGSGETAVTVTDPSTARSFWTVKPGETIVRLATGRLKMVNLSPTASSPGPPLISRKMPPLVCVMVAALKTLLDGDNDRSRPANKVLPETMVRSPATSNEP